MMRSRIGRYLQRSIRPSIAVGIIVGTMALAVGAGVVADPQGFGVPTTLFRPQTFQGTSATTNATQTVLTLRGTTPGSPSLNFGPRLDFESKFPDGTTGVSGAIDSPVTVSGHSGGVRLQTGNSGTLTTALACVPASPCTFSSDLVASATATVNGAFSALSTASVGSNLFVAGDISVTGGDIFGTAGVALTVRSADGFSGHNADALILTGGSAYTGTAAGGVHVRPGFGNGGGDNGVTIDRQGSAGVYTPSIDVETSGVFITDRLIISSNQVASGGDLTLPANINFVTGSATVNAITTSVWDTLPAGAPVVNLVFVGPGHPTLKNFGTGGAGTAPMILQGGTDWTPAGDVASIQFTYGGGYWIELSRSVGTASSGRGINSWSTFFPAGLSAGVEYNLGATDVAVGSVVTGWYGRSTTGIGSGGSVGYVVQVECGGVTKTCALDCAGASWGNICAFSPPITVGSTTRCTTRLDATTDCAVMPPNVNVTVSVQLP